MARGSARGCEDGRVSSGRRGRAGAAERYAGLVVRFRWLVVLAAALLVGTLLSAGIPHFGRDGLTLRELASVDAPEIQTELTAAQVFRIPLNGRVQVVRRDPDGLSIGTQRSDLQRAFDLTRQVQMSGSGPVGLYLPYANTEREFPGSRESSTTTIVNIVGYPDATLTSREAAGEQLAEAARGLPGGRVSVTGGVPAQLETGRIIRAHLGLLQALSIAALVLITAAWLRSLVVPVLVAGTIGGTTLVLLHTLDFAGRRDWLTVPAEVLPVVLSVAIGIATDYVLFYLGALRRALPGREPLEAARLAVTETVPVVLTAGVTTAIGAGSLLLAETGFVRAFAPGLVVAVLAAMVICLVLTPALMTVLSPWIFWPSRVRPTPPFGGVPGLVTADRRRIRLVVAGGVLLLAALASQVASSPLGFNIVTGLPEDNEVSIGARDAEAGFAKGILSPTIVLVRGHDLTSRRDELAALADAVTEEPGVAGVLGANTFERALRRTGLDEQLTETVRADEQGLLTTADGRYARFIVVLEEEAFTGAAASDLDRLAQRLPELADEHHLGRGTVVEIAGDTALVRRVTMQLDTDLVRVAGALLVVEIGLLLLALRSWRHALFVVAASLAVTAAAVGATSLFDRWFGDGVGIAFFVPIAAFVLLVSIGVDYGVLMGRALAAERRAGLTGASRADAAMRAVGPTITQAGVVLLVTFALLAVVPIGAFTQFAVVMATGVALDTLLVRPLLMPLILAGSVRHPGKWVDRQHRPVRRMVRRGWQ
jgi:RND superfamily putative drug exporter